MDSKVVVESITCFGSVRKETEVVKMYKPKKHKSKVVMVSSEEEEPIEYVYKRKSRPEKQHIKRYKKVIY